MPKGKSKKKSATPNPAPRRSARAAQPVGQTAAPWRKKKALKKKVTKQKAPDPQKRIQDLEEMLAKMVQERAEEKKALEEKNAVQPKNYFKWVKVPAEMPSPVKMRRRTSAHPPPGPGYIYN